MGRHVLLILSIVLLATGIVVLAGACAFALTSAPASDQVGAYRTAFYQRALFGIACLMLSILLLRVRRGRNADEEVRRP